MEGSDNAMNSMQVYYLSTAAKKKNYPKTQWLKNSKYLLSNVLSMGQESGNS